MFAKLVEEMRAAGRDVDTTTHELFQALEGRLEKIEERIFGKKPEGDVAHEDDEEDHFEDWPTCPSKDVDKHEPPAVVNTDPVASLTPKDPALGKQTVESLAMAAATPRVSQSDGKFDPQAVKSADAPSMAPVPLTNTDAQHPADMADPMKANDPGAL